MRMELYGEVLGQSDPEITKNCGPNSKISVALCHTVTELERKTCANLQSAQALLIHETFSHYTGFSILSSIK